EVRSILVQPKRLAFFSYLVLARPAGFHRRDSLLALFWPESDTERARLALRQSLHFVRKALGDNVVVTRGDEEIEIAAESLWCDAAAFESAVDTGRWAEALELYRGDLLSGLFAADVSPEFQDWLERERTRLRARAAGAAWQLSAAADREQNVAAAANWGRRAIGLAPDDEAGIRRFITLLDRLGDRAGALREHDEFATRLKREFDVEPAPETRVLMEEVRSRARAPELHDGDKPHPTNPALLVSGRTESASSAAASRSAGPPARTLAAKLNESVRKWLVIGSSIGTLATIGIATFMLRSRPESAPLLAVGSITNEAGAGAEETARLLPGLLATDLSRVAGLSVVSQPRLLETLVQLDSRDETTQALADAARRAGASEILEGVLYRRGTTLRLDLRRVDLRRRLVRESYSASGSDAFELTERATADIARAFALTAPATPLAASGSLVARRFYDQGLRAYYRGEWRGAYELFSATLEEDSTFAMAAYYAAQSIARFRTDSAFLLLEEAARLAELAPERERLTIRHARYPHAYAPRAAYAESLAIRFPSEPSGHLAVATLRVAIGNFLGAVPYAQRAIALDSASLQNEPPVCYACDAYEILLKAYASIGVDSFLAVERTARDWINRQPGSGAGWQALAGALSWRGEKDAALDALGQAARHQPEATPAAIFWSAVIKGEDYREAERLLRNRLRFDERDGEALWWLVVTLRHQGRASEALALARRGWQLAPPANWEGVTMWAQMEAHQLYELGRFQEAGLRFHQLIQIGPYAPSDPDYAAWRLSW
ncbi:MAG TPA: BTAD domain-containing putative transcriptional regulator, partial [Longimicrobiales bacterium]|nr:BTAD domain-containing putative transcriptional regulator [Longimicrobiales bacterium]